MEKVTFGNKKIAVIGAGHIGKAIVKGLSKAKKINQTNILISDKKNNIEIVKKSDYVLIAVKPLKVKEVLEEIKMFIDNKIIISVAAGVDIKIIEKIIGKDKKIVRLMPSIPVSENKGIIGFITNNNLLSLEKKNILDLTSVLGKIVVVKNEKDLDTLSLLTGCGPALSAYFIEFFSNYALKHGFSKDESINLALHLFNGTISYLQTNNLTPADLMESVATKGGTTEEILNSLNKKELNKLFEESMKNGENKLNNLKKKLKAR